MVFIGILFAERLLDPAVLVPVSGLFLAFCLGASCVYLFNDIRDLEEDRRHPQKKSRPIASGQISVPVAWTMAFCLAAAAFTLVACLSPISHALGLPVPPEIERLPVPPGVAALAIYLTVNIAYTAKLKRIAIADVSCVALGFLIRVVAGPAVAGVEVSSWLVLVTFFGALFLATSKRRGELLSTAGSNGGRSVLRQYDDRSLDILVGMAATATLLTYSIYTVVPETVDKLGTRNLLYTIPLVFYGIGRYLILLYGRQLGEDPAAVLFGDRGLIVAIATWLTMSATILAWAG